MVQFATPEHQKGGQKKKPKKELGAWMDVVQMIAPIAVSVVGTPLAGAAVSALLEGAESKLEGGSWKEALMKGAISGGVGAATGGLTGGSDKVAGEALKKTVEESTKGAAKKTGESFLTQGTIQGAKNIAGKTGDELIKGVAGSLTDEASKRFTGHVSNMARDAAIDKMLASGEGEAGAKQRFFEHAQTLGEMGLGAYTSSRAEAAQGAQAGALQNQALMQRIQGAMEGQYQPQRSRYYKPYGV